MAIINGSDFGVVSGTEENMIEGFRSVFAACEGVDKPTVRLGGGIIHLWDEVGLDSYNTFLASGQYGEPEKYWPPEWRIGATIDSIDDLTIDGGGATLMMHGFTQPFLFVKCSRLKLENLTIDWDKPAYSVATVISCQGTELVVRVWEEFEWLEATPGRKGLLWETRTGSGRRRYHGFVLILHVH